MASFPVYVTVLAACVICGYSQTVTPKRTYKVSTILVPPFLTSREKTLSDGTKEVIYDGYIRDLLDHMFSYVNGSYEFHVVKDDQFGQKLPNGSWTGMIGSLVDKRVDLAAGPLTESSQRSKVVDFSTPFMTYGPVVILKRPQAPVMTLEERLQRLFLPLSQSVWMMSGLAWLVTSAVLYIICYVNPYDWRRLMKDRQATLREGEAFTCLNTFWFTISNFVWQGYTRSPRSVGGRVVVTFWWFYVMIFIIMYIASMTNYLRVGPTPGVTETYTSIQSIEDLAKQSKVDYGVIMGGTTEQYIGNAQVAYLRRVWSTIKEMNSQVVSLMAGVDRVRTSQKPFALIAESAMAKFYTKQSPCDIYMVGDFTTIGGYALAFPAGSLLVKQMDTVLLMLKEKGVLRELEERWFTGECTQFVLNAGQARIEIPPFYRVDLGSFSGALIILGIGLILGAVVTALEVFIFRYAEVGEKPKRESQQPLNSTRAASQNAGGVANMEPEPITDV